MLKNISVYSASIGNYDQYIQNTDIIRFSYDRYFATNNRMAAKKFKVLSHQYLSSEFSIWIDGNVELVAKPQEFVDMMEDNDVLIFEHPDRSNVFEEAEVIKTLYLDNPEIVSNQIEFYKEMQYKHSLYSCRLIVRRHNREIENANNKWWSEITKWSYRDQLSFAHAFSDTKIKSIEHPQSYTNDFFVVHPRKIPSKFYQRIDLLRKRFLSRYD